MELKGSSNYFVIEEEIIFLFFFLLEVLNLSRDVTQWVELSRLTDLVEMCSWTG